MEITFRAAVPGDFEAITDLINRANPWEPAISLEAFKFYVERADRGRARVHLVAQSDGRIIGHGFLRGTPVYEPLYLNVDVDPAHQRRGSQRSCCAAWSPVPPATDEGCTPS